MKYKQVGSHSIMMIVLNAFTHIIEQEEAFRIPTTNLTTSLLSYYLPLKYEYERTASHLPHYSRSLLIHSLTQRLVFPSHMSRPHLVKLTLLSCFIV